MDMKISKRGLGKILHRSGLSEEGSREGNDMASRYVIEARNDNGGVKVQGPMVVAQRVYG